MDERKDGKEGGRKSHIYNHHSSPYHDSELVVFSHSLHFSLHPFKNPYLLAALCLGYIVIQKEELSMPYGTSTPQ